MEKRILAVLIAAFAGSAAAQSYVTSGAGGVTVTNGFGDCWRPGSASTGSSACPPTAAGSSAAAAAPRTQVAQASDSNRSGRSSATESSPRRTSTEANMAAAPVTGNPPAPPGYVGSGSGVVATSAFGLCWHAGSDWTPEKAAAPCDAVPRASMAPPPVAVAPAPEPTPAPVAVVVPTPVPEPVVIEKISLSTDVLFGFNKAELTHAGEEKLDEIAKNAQSANVERVRLVGHADRIGSEEYNQELSEKRAQAVAEYLAAKGVASDRLEVEGRGKSEPITGNECTKMGPANNRNQKLIACLQPDRRVDAEFLGSRESTASSGAAPAGAGATGSPGSSSGSTSQ